jgi:heme-degrading monooxygenase HmoA
MYLHHELREVAVNRQTEALERISTLHHLMQESHGFIRSLACRYLGNFTQYAWLRTWDSSQAHLAFRQTEPAKAFGRTRPEGLYWPLPRGIAPDGHWQSIMDSGDQDGDSGYLVRMAFSVPRDASEAFIESRSLHDELALASPGIVSIATFESETDADERTYLSLVRMNAPGAYRTFLGSKQAAATLEADGSIRNLLVTECYEIVEELRRR